MDLRELCKDLITVELARGSNVKAVCLAPNYGEPAASYVTFNTADRPRYFRTLRFFQNTVYGSWRGPPYLRWMPPSLYLNLKRFDVDFERVRFRMDNPLRFDETLLDSLIAALVDEIQKCEEAEVVPDATPD